MNSNLTDIKVAQKFGITAFIFFGALCSLGFLMKKPVAIYLFGTLSFLGLCLILMPTAFTPVYIAWQKIAHFLGIVVTTLILTVAYYLVITPSALIKRLFGGRPIPTKPDRKTLSYWVPRPEPSQPKERFIKRY